jgi:hypothetical protein
MHRTGEWIITFLMRNIRYLLMVKDNLFALKFPTFQAVLYLVRSFLLPKIDEGMMALKTIARNRLPLACVKLISGSPGFLFGAGALQTIPNTLSTHLILQAHSNVMRHCKCKCIPYSHLHHSLLFSR